MISFESFRCFLRFYWLLTQKNEGKHYPMVQHWLSTRTLRSGPVLLFITKFVIILVGIAWLNCFYTFVRLSMITCHVASFCFFLCLCDLAAIFYFFYFEILIIRSMFLILSYYYGGMNYKCCYQEMRVGNMFSDVYLDEQFVMAGMFLKHLMVSLAGIVRYWLILY